MTASLIARNCKVPALSSDYMGMFVESFMSTASPDLWTALAMSYNEALNAYYKDNTQQNLFRKIQVLVDLTEPTVDSKLTRDAYLDLGAAVERQKRSDAKT